MLSFLILCMGFVYNLCYMCTMCLMIMLYVLLTYCYKEQHYHVLSVLCQGPNELLLHLYLGTDVHTHAVPVASRR